MLLCFRAINNGRRLPFSQQIAHLTDSLATPVAGREEGGGREGEEGESDKARKKG